MKEYINSSGYIIFFYDLCVITSASVRNKRQDKHARSFKALSSCPGFLDFLTESL